MILTLPTDSAERKEYPLFDGCFAYFPAALAEIARHSKEGNDQHNPGEPIHHARGKSMDHENCILRHTVDLGDLKAALRRDGALEVPAVIDAIIYEATARAWRSLAALQELCEELRGAPLAPAARLPEPEPSPKTEKTGLAYTGGSLQDLKTLPEPEPTNDALEQTFGQCNTPGCLQGRSDGARYCQDCLDAIKPGGTA